MRLQWGVTFLIGNSLISPMEQQRLILRATEMYYDKDDTALVTGGCEEHAVRYEGIMTTKREWKVLGGFSGQQFSADLVTVDAKGTEERVVLKFLVSEQTLRGEKAVRSASAN